MQNIKKVISPDVYCVSRASDVINKQEMETLGADYVFMPSKIVATALARSLERAESLKRGNRLSKWLKEISGKKLAIVVHDNPDPDAIASAVALKEIATNFDVDATILYHGEIGHQENKAFVNLLAIELEKWMNMTFPDSIRLPWWTVPYQAPIISCLLKHRLGL